MKDFNVMLNELYKGTLELEEGMYSSNNENGERITLMYNKKSNVLTIYTNQSNGWTRINVYHQDGTVEEMYEK